MARPWPEVRAVEDGDWDRLYDLWTCATAVGVLAAEPGGHALTAERLQHTLTRPGVATFVAVQDDQVVGVLVATTNPLSALTDAPSVTVEVLYVAASARGRGCGRQLLARAATLAEQTGAATVASHVPSQAREVNRFFARMGFTSTVTRRICSTVALRRRLAGPEPRPLDKVLARRRTQRARAGQGTESSVPVLRQRVS